jgi:adenylate kinase
MNIVLLGAPGSGKGTQAALIAKELGLYLLQTGQLALDLAKKDQRIRKIISSGKLIPEEEMTMYVVDFLSNKKPELSNILFEGFPRFISQFEALSNFLRTKGDDIDLVISIDISKAEAVRRIAARRICEKCGEIYNLITNPPPSKVCKCGGRLIQRADDNPESVKVRFEYYKDNTKALIDYVSKLGELEKVDGERPIEAIYKDIRAKIIKAKNEEV